MSTHEQQPIWLASINATERETTNMLVNMATRVGLSYALALIVLAAVMMVVNG